MTNSKSTETKTEVKPSNPTNVKKAISTGQEMMKKGGVTKAEVSRAIYDLVKDEHRDVIVQVFIDGCGLTPKGAMTYVYNIRRKLKKSS
jgi:NADH:ubiquinone oxidoreductase subunit B-like Fe-S oxidoreductase